MKQDILQGIKRDHFDPPNFDSIQKECINEVIDRINDSLDIVELIRDSPKAHNFQGSGDRYTAHTNSNSQSGASLIITPREQKWHDKATGEGGLAFNWIAYELLGTSRPRGKDVLHVLEVAAEKVGITLNNYSEEDKALFQEALLLNRYFMKN